MPAAASGIRVSATGRIDPAATYPRVEALTAFSVRAIPADRLGDPRVNVYGGIGALFAHVPHALGVSFDRPGLDIGAVAGGNTVVQVSLANANGARVVHLAAGSMPTGFTITGLPRWHAIVYRVDQTHRFLFGFAGKSHVFINARIDVSYDDWKTRATWCDFNLLGNPDGLDPHDPHADYAPAERVEQAEALLAQCRALPSGPAGTQRAGESAGAGRRLRNARRAAAAELLEPPRSGGPVLAGRRSDRLDAAAAGTGRHPAAGLVRDPCRIGRLPGAGRGCSGPGVSDMLIPVIFIVALLATLSTVLLENSLLAAQRTLHTTAERYADAAISDGVADFTAGLAAFVKANGSRGPWPGAVSRSFPKSMCDPAVAVAACPFSYIISGTITSSAGDATAGRSDAAINLQTAVIEEGRLSPLVTATLSAQNGTVFGVRSRLLTYRVFAAAPYAIVSGSGDATALSGSASPAQGDSGGADDRPTADDGGLPHDTRIHVQLTCAANGGNDGLPWGANAGGAHETRCERTASPADAFADHHWTNGNAAGSGWTP